MPRAAAEHAARLQDHHDLPGPADLADAAHDDRRADHRDPAHPPARAAGRSRTAQHRNPRTGAHSRSAPAHEAISARTFRRHAPARDDRHGDGVRAGPSDRRRADHRARRDRAGADPRHHARPAEGAENRHRHDQPRHGRDRRHGRPRAGDARRRDRGDGRRRRDLLRTRSTPIPRRCWTRCRASTIRRHAGPCSTPAAMAGKPETAARRSKTSRSISRSAPAVSSFPKPSRCAPWTASASR